MARSGYHWTIRNYNTFLRKIRHKEGLSYKQAQDAYRNLRDHLQRPVTGADVLKHPRLTHNAVRKMLERKVKPTSATRAILEREYGPDWEQYIEAEPEWEDFEWPVDYEGD